MEENDRTQPAVDVQPQQQEITMFELPHQQSEKSLRPSQKAEEAEDGQQQPENGKDVVDSEHRQPDASGEQLGDEQQQQPAREEQSPSHSRSAAQTSEVTDEKLFLESNGFGEPKRRTSDQDEKEQHLQSQDTHGSINIAVPVQQPQQPETMSQDNAAGEPGEQQQALPFFVRRRSSNSRHHGPDSKQDQQPVSQQQESYNPAATAGFPQDPIRDNMRNSGSQVREQSKTMTTLAPLGSKPSLPVPLKKKLLSNQTPQRVPRHQSQSRLGQSGAPGQFQQQQPLPSLVKPSAMTHSRSISHFGKTFPVPNQQSAQQQTSSVSPSKAVARKTLHQKLQIRQAYSKTSMSHFIEKGAFGGAMQEIFQDQVNAQIEAHDVSTIDYNPDVNEKKARRKQRLNQILTAASKGRHTITPTIEVEEIAHQYHNLKIEFNRVKDENSRMKTRLAKMSQQASKRDDRLISLNQELLALKMEQSQAYPMAAVEQHRFPDYPGDTSAVDATNITLNPAHPTLFQSQMSVSGKNAALPSSGSKDPNMAKLEKSALVLSLKKQVNELRKQSEKRQEEVIDLQRSTKVCVYNELDAQLEAYTDECKRLREKLEESVLQIMQLEKQNSIQQHYLDENRSRRQKIQLRGQEDTEDDETAAERHGGGSTVDGADEEEHNESVKDEDHMKSVNKDHDAEADEIEVGTDAEGAAGETNESKERELEEAPEKRSSQGGGYVLPNDTENGDEDEEIRQGSKPQYQTEDPSQQDENEGEKEVDNKEADVQPLDDKTRPETPPRFAMRVKNNGHSPDDKQAPSRSMQARHERSPNAKPPGGRNAAAGMTPQKSKHHSRASSMQKRFLALNENVRSKNLQITDLNRQLKNANESHQKQQKFLQKKNRELMANLKQMEKLLKKKKQMDEAGIDGEESKSQGAQSENEHDTLMKPTGVKASKDASKPPTMKKISKKKVSKSPIRAANKGSKASKQKKEQSAVTATTQAAAAVQEQENAKKAEAAPETKSESDRYSQQSFDSEKDGGQSLGGGGDVSTVKKNQSEVGGKDREEGAKSHGYTSIDDEDANDAMEDEVEKQFQKSIRSGSIDSNVEIQEPQPSSERAAQSNKDKNSQISSTSKNNVKAAEALSEAQNSQKNSKKQSTSPQKLSEKKDPSQASKKDSTKAQNKPMISQNDIQSVQATVTERKEATERTTSAQKEQDTLQEETKTPRTQVQDSLINERSTYNNQNARQEIGLSHFNKNCIGINVSDSSNKSSKIRSVQSELKNVKMSTRKDMAKADIDESTKQLQIQDDTKNDHLLEMKEKLAGPGTPKSKNLRRESNLNQVVHKLDIKTDQQQKTPESNSQAASKREVGKGISISSPTVGQIQQPQQQESANLSNKKDSDEPEKVSDADGDAIDEKAKKSHKSKSKQSENMLLDIDQEKKPLEGQSCGRNEDSEITSNQNDEQQSNQEKQISEEQMLDIAESILRELAEKLLENEWSVKDVFDHPKLVHILPKYENQENVVALSAQNFLGRMYQIGFQEITQLQVACMMRVLGKYDLDNAILFDDLMTLLENYGVSGTKASVTNNQSLDRSNIKSELPEAESGRGTDQKQATGADPVTATAQNEGEEVAPSETQKEENKDAPEPEISPDKTQEVANKADKKDQEDEERKEEDPKDNYARNPTLSVEQDSPTKTKISNSAASGQDHEEVKSLATAAADNKDNNKDTNNADEPLQRKITRRDSILDRVHESTNKESTFTKLREQIVTYSTNLETLMDIFKAKSYKQNIKSKSRQSETLVIQKHDFFELINTMLNQATQIESGSTTSAAQRTRSLDFTAEEVNEIEHCIQLTPKFPTMYAVRHIETLFQALLETATEQHEAMLPLDSMREEGQEQDDAGSSDQDNVAIHLFSYLGCGAGQIGGLRPDAGARGSHQQQFLTDD